MSRFIALLLLGTFIGSLTVYTLQQAADPADITRTTALGSFTDTAIATSDELPPALATPDLFTSGLALRESIAAETSATSLEAMIREFARNDDANSNRSELEALLVRLSELDPWRAVQLARELELSDAVLIGLFKAWADTDPDSALAELRLLTPPAAQRQLALALLDVFGLDPAGIDRIAVTFPADEAMNFRIDALGKMAERDLDGALAAASNSGLPQDAESRAQQRIARTMAGIDPATAFEKAQAFAQPLLRTRYLSALVDTWASIDPQAALDFLQDAELPQITLSEASFQALAASGPEQLLVLAESFSPRTRSNAQQAALEALTSLDPITAYNRLSTLPPSGDTDRLLAGIAERFASTNPEGALTWVATLEPRSVTAMNAVLASIAQDDPVRAADVFIEQILDPVAANSAVQMNLGSLLTGDAATVTGIADRFAAHGDPRVRAQLTQLMTRWPQQAPEAALGWALRNTGALSPQTAQTLAQQIAQLDPASARQTISRMPRHLQGVWLDSAGAVMAGDDFQGTLNWIEQYSANPAYAQARQTVLRRGAAQDPATVAALISDDTGLRNQLATNIASAWAASDPESARLWVNELTAGPERDQGLRGLLNASARNGEFDMETFHNLSSDTARQAEISNAAFILGQTNPTLGRQLINDNIDDPEMRAGILRTLELGQSQGQMATGGLPPAILIRP